MIFNLCDGCMHSKVCKHKEQYLKDVAKFNEIYDKVTSITDPSDWSLPDVVVAVIFEKNTFKCEHFRRDAMTINEYQKSAYRTVNPELDQKEQLMDGLMGLNGEAGECIDILKKALFQGHELDVDALATELGDVAWYLAISAHAIEYSLEEIFDMNIDKLKARYPDGFDSEHSINREENDI